MKALHVMYKFHGVGVGGGDSIKLYTGRPRPKVKPLTLLYTILTEKVLISHIFN